MRPGYPWVKIGSFSVDAGICWIGDPCYVKGLFKDWHKFVDKLGPGVTEFKEGICLPSGYGDGQYFVYAKYNRGTIEQVLIDFHGEDEDDE